MYIIYVNDTLPLALAVHEISRHFWAAYEKFTKITPFDKYKKFILQKSKYYSNKSRRV